MMLLSNSKNPGSEYLDHVVKDIERFVGNASNALFIPYAGVTFSWDEYTDIVRKPFAGLGIMVTPIHTIENPIERLSEFDLILVGGGNTFRLLDLLYQNKLIDPIRDHIDTGNAIYIGWSAGSNVAGPSIKTTNDMPIVQPESFNGFGLVPFLINPHYTEKTIPGHGGESRAQRIDEFVELNPDDHVVCIPEGSWIKVEGDTYTYSGQHQGILRNKAIGSKPLEVGKSIEL